MKHLLMKFRFSVQSSPLAVYSKRGFCLWVVLVFQVVFSSLLHASDKGNSKNRKEAELSSFSRAITRESGVNKDGGQVMYVAPGTILYNPKDISVQNRPRAKVRRAVVLKSSPCKKTSPAGVKKYKINKPYQYFSGRSPEGLYESTAEGRLEFALPGVSLFKPGSMCKDDSGYLHLKKDFGYSEVSYGIVWCEKRILPLFNTAAIRPPPCSFFYPS